MTEIALVGATFYGNRGAEAMLSTAMGALRERLNDEPHFHVFSYYARRDRQIVDDPHIEIHSASPTSLVLVLIPGALAHRLFGALGLSTLQRYLPRSVRALASSRVLLCLAGISFVDSRLKFLPFNVATLLPALLLGVPTVKLAQACGPFQRPLNRHVAQALLGRCRHIFARGRQTAAHLQSLLVRNTWELADDVAFLFKPAYGLSRNADAAFASRLATLDRSLHKSRPVVGLCPSSVVAHRMRAGGRSYTTLVTDIVHGLVARGYLVVLFPHATRSLDMRKRHNNDLPLLNDIHAALAPSARKSVVLFGGPLNVAQIYDIIRSCDVVAVSRFHAMVSALSLAVPTVVLGWSHKYVEVMERFHQEDMVLDDSVATTAAIIARVDTLVAEREHRSRVIAKSLPAVKALAERQIDYIADLLGEGP